MKEKSIQKFRIDISFNNAIVSDFYNNGTIRILKPIFTSDSLPLTEIDLNNIRSYGKHRSEKFGIPFIYFNHDLAEKVIRIKKLKKS